MKKITALTILIITSFLLIGCQKREIEYTDNNPIRIDMQNETLKILQITDLHLTYGIDYNDQKTFRLIEQLAKNDTYDLIIITGDLTMSPQGPHLFRRLIKTMENIKIPWTFIFGNHETDFHDYQAFLKEIKNTTYLKFKVGPKLEDGGVGNFKIEVMRDGGVFYNLYFLDTKAERKDYTPEQGEYDYLSTAQVEWYRDYVVNDEAGSLIFMHIPLRQYMKAEEVGYDGYFKEDKVYAQGIDTGFFDAMVIHQKSIAVFVGHDHLNDFTFTYQDILLAYGRATGYNAYGTLKKGGRHIEINATKTLTTFIIEEDEVLK
ncbi:MAG: metallophosphoesterase [Bacilli bacterium]